MSSLFRTCFPIFSGSMVVKRETTSTIWQSKGEKKLELSCCEIKIINLKLCTVMLLGEGIVAM